MMEATDIIHKIRKYQTKSVTLISQRLSGRTTVSVSVFGLDLLGPNHHLNIFFNGYMIQSLQGVGSLAGASSFSRYVYELFNINTNKIFLHLVSLKRGAAKNSASAEDQCLLLRGFRPSRFFCGAS